MTKHASHLAIALLCYCLGEYRVADAFALPTSVLRRRSLTRSSQSFPSRTSTADHVTGMGMRFVRMKWEDEDDEEDECYMYETLDDDVSRLSTSELLAELDKRNIRYSPTATRQHLEHLLQEEWDDDDSESSRSRRSRNAEEMAAVMQELASMGVPLPRYASREDLERLLRQAQQEPTIHWSKSTGRRRRRRPPPPATETPTTKRRRRQHVAISRLQRELNELGIPCPPGASPLMMERMLRESEGQPLTPPPSPSRRQRSRRSRQRYPPRQEEEDQEREEVLVDGTGQLLDELSRRGIRYAPSATRQELEDLLRSSTQTVVPEGAPPTADDDDGRTTERSDNINNHGAGQDANTDEGMGDDSGNKQSAEQEHEQQEPSVTACKGEVSQGSKSQPVEAATSPSSRRRTRRQRRPGGMNESKQHGLYASNNNQQRRRKATVNRSVWSKVYDKSKQTVTDGIKGVPDYAAKRFDGATSRLSKAAEKAARKARQATRNAKDFFAEDEYGIRDAQFEYVTPQANKDVIIDVPAEPVVDPADARSRYSRATRSHPSGSRARAAGANSGPYQARSMRNGRARQRHRNSQATERNPQGPEAPENRKAPIANPASQSSLFRLPPAASKETSNGKATPKTRQRRRRSSRPADENGSRRVYTPYGENDPSSQVYRDAIDKFGDFFASTTDTILWGKLDDEEKGDGSPTRKNGQARKSACRKQSTNWRDRMEERFDSMMGIHEDGAFYNRWAVQEELEEEEESGEWDAFSVAQGRAPKRRHQPRRAKRKIYDKPFWEESNLLSTLFGKSPPSGFENVNVGRVLPLIKTVAKTLILVAANACEWASVRGSLPQPAVVVGVTSCVVAARPGKRFLALVLSLVAFRIFGELIHEGLYGGEDWEEGSYDDDDEGYDADDEGEASEGMRLAR